MAQSTPCDCAERWAQGATWNTDGTVDDAGGNPLNISIEGGVIRCAISAETQSGIDPICSYQPTDFTINLNAAICPGELPPATDCGRGLV